MEKESFNPEQEKIERYRQEYEHAKMVKKREFADIKICYYRSSIMILH